jgi:ribosome recycling factor
MVNYWQLQVLPVFVGFFCVFKVSLNLFFIIDTLFVEEIMIKETVKEAEHHMKSALHVLEEELTGIRTGRATPALIEKLPIDYYGMPTPLMQLASISVPDARSLLIKPFDPTSLKTIEKSILASDLGLTPNNDGKSIRLNLPPLTEDRRHDLVKVVHVRLEETRIAVRNIRRDVIKELREFEKEKMISEDDLKLGEDEIQKLTDHMITEIDAIGVKKEKEIMEV